MAFPLNKMTEVVRRKLELFLYVTHILTILTSFMLIGFGVYIRFAIDSKVALAGDYNNDVLPWVMVGIGIPNLIVGLVGAYLCKPALVVYRRFALRALRLPYMRAAFFSTIGLFGVAMLAFGHIEYLHSSFSNGLIQAMQLYKNDSNVKKDLDQLQMDYKCCGSVGYQDWFRLSWVLNDYLILDVEAVRKYLKEENCCNVPFSCCDPNALRPCITHYVTTDDTHHNYKHEPQTTLYEQGCRDALMNYFSKVLQESTIVIVVIFVIEIVNIFGMRFLQTSGQECGDTPGWLFGSSAEEAFYESLRNGQYAGTPSSGARLADLSSDDEELVDRIPTIDSFLRRRLPRWMDVLFSR